ncbi:hypothetical protein [Hyphococcus sp.]|uniref:hypothetical protein n=1 Tax=Hyphococcus sp. TaxID=2038636 RepID=UPI003CCC269A
MVAIRPIIMGAGAVGAAATAFVAQQQIGGDGAPEAGAGNGYEICLKTEMPLFSGAGKGCYGGRELSALLDNPVLDLQGEAVQMSMTHPTDTSVAPQTCRTCRDYREMNFDGWFAPNSREMRREGYFVRACGALAAMMNAQAPSRSFFSDGSPTAEEVAGLKGVLRIGEVKDEADRVVVSQPGDYQWRVAADSRFVEMQELANADFDNDGMEEVLVFLAGGTEGGTALFYDVGLMQKDAADADLTYAPLSFDQRNAGGAAR